MSRIYRVKSSRKVRVCRTGNHEIPVGSPYSYTAPGFRGREIYACSAHPFRESELTTGLKSQPLAAREALHETVDAIDLDGGLESLEELRSAWEEFTSALQEYVDARSESLESWENGNSVLEELLQAAEEALENAEGHEIEEWEGDTDLLEWDEPEPKIPGDEPDPEEADVYAAWLAEVEEYDKWAEALDNHQEAYADFQEFLQTQISDAVDVADSLEF